jgi:excisionase family DNA binding protein
MKSEVKRMSHEEALVSNGLVTIKDASGFLGLSRAMIYKLMDAGRLHFVKIGKSRRIPRQALTNLAKDNLLGGWQAE